MTEDKFITFEKLNNAILWLWVVACGVLYKFFKWFFVREYNSFVTKIQTETREELHSINRKLEVHEDTLNNISESLKNYKTVKHDIQNENAALTGSMQICKEALEIADKIIKKHEKNN